MMNEAPSSITSQLDQLLNDANTFAQNEQFESAKDCYEQVLASSTEHPAANHEMGVVLCRMGSIEQALPYFKKAIQFGADVEQYWVTYFDALIALDDKEAATTALNYGVQYGLHKSTARVLASEHGLDFKSNENTLVRLPKLGPTDLTKVKNFQTNNYWFVNDRDRFKSLMDEAMSLIDPSGGFYFSDNLFTWGRNMSCLDDAHFFEAWKNNIMVNTDTGIVWRRYIIACAAYHAVQLEGDFVECGVFQGTGIKTVMDYLGGKDFPKTFWGYDTYDYNPVENHANEFQKEGFFESILARFDGYDQVKLVKGFIPDAFNQGVPEKIAYLHIDLNNAAAELHVLDHLFDRVVSGGVVIMDDYEWSGMYRDQKAAEDPWFDARGYRLMPLPTGQGLLYKR